jgi:hypothetical protein
MKWLLFDADRSMSAIGGREAATQKLGFPPISVTTGTRDVLQVFAKLFDYKQQTAKHELFDDLGGPTEMVFTLSPKAQELGMYGIAIDTFSVISDQEVFALLAKSKTGRMEKQHYGELSEVMGKFIQTISKLPVPIVVLCHEGEPKEAANEKVVIYPAVKGSTKTDMLRFFDVVAYIEAKRDKAGKFKPAWLVEPTEEKFAKNRGGILGQYVDPDLGKIVEAYVQAGTPHPKILVVGKSGTGKTTSLLTLGD